VARRPAVSLALASIAAVALCAQARRPVFDTASVKPSAPSAGTSIGPAGDRLVATNVPLHLLIRYAYRSASGRMFLDVQMIGAPRWAETERFDIQAKAASSGGAVPPGQLQLMLQSMLEDRFQVQTHREMRELPVYSLVVAKSGVKMPRSPDQTPPETDGPPRVFVPGAPPLRGRFKMIGKPSASGAITLGVTGSGISISTLINVLQQYVDRPIVDASGVDGLYEVQLEFGLPQSQAAAPLDEPVGVALFTALQEQLGLKFDAVRKPVEVLVIDRAEHPKAD